MPEKDFTVTKTGEVITVDDTFKIDSDELIEELENIGDYDGIKKVKKDLEKLK